MRKLLLATVFGLSVIAGVHAQVKLHGAGSDPTTGLSADDWLSMYSQEIDLRGTQDLPIIAILNASPIKLSSITCDKWQIVGANKYNGKGVKDNPVEIPPWHVVFIRTDGFDNYCHDGVIGHPNIGKDIVGTLDVPGDFTKSTRVIFLKPQ